MALDSAAEAGVRLIVLCRDYSNQIKPDHAEQKIVLTRR
jgi:hypothetical protein